MEAVERKNGRPEEFEVNVTRRQVLAEERH